MEILYSVEVLKEDVSDKYHNIMKQVFTKDMNIRIFDNRKENTLVILINDILKMTFHKTKLMKRIQNQSGKGISRNVTRKKPKSKTNTKSKTKSKSKFNKIGGGKLKHLILGVIVFFATDMLVEIQWVHDALDIIPPNEFHNADIFKYNTDLKPLLEKVDTINLIANMTTSEIQKQLKIITNSKGKSLSLTSTNGSTNNKNKERTNSKLDVFRNNKIINYSEEYRPAFIEVDLSKEGPTSKLIHLMENLPKQMKSYIYFGSDSAGYHVGCNWKLNESDEVEVELYDVMGDTRFRTFPKMKQIDDIIKKTYQQQIHIMRKTNILSKEETHGFGKLVIVNTSPITTKTFNNNTDYFHQDGMQLHTHLDNSTIKFGDYNVRKSLIEKSNIKMTRPTTFDNIMTMTYSKGVVDAKYRSMNTKGNTTNIKTTNQSGFTRIYDQSRGIEHSAKRFSRFDTDMTTRNIAILQIMPNTEGNFYVKDNEYIKR